IITALKLCRRFEDRRLAQAVRACLRHPSPAVRAAAVEAMETAGLSDPRNLIEGFLMEPPQNLRRAAVSYMLPRGRRPLELARRLLDGPDTALRQYALDSLSEHPRSAPGAVTGEWLDARLKAGGPEDLMLAARALGALARGIPAARL